MTADVNSSAPAGGRNVDQPRAILSLLLVASVTEAMFLVLPSFVGALTDVLHFSPGRTGLLGSAILESRDGRLPFPGASFDLVTNNQVLEHVPDLDATLGELDRVRRSDRSHHVFLPDPG